MERARIFVWCGGGVNEGGRGLGDVIGEALTARRFGVERAARGERLDMSGCVGVIAMMDWGVFGAREGSVPEAIGEALVMLRGVMDEARCVGAVKVAWLLRASNAGEDAVSEDGEHIPGAGGVLEEVSWAMECELYRYVGGECGAPVIGLLAPEVEEEEEEVARVAIALLERGGVGRRYLVGRGQMERAREELGL